MLLRDLDWKPREEQHFFDVATLKLADGRTMHFERGAARWPGFIAMTVAPCSDPGVLPWSRCNPDLREFEDDEFTAQAVLDHYIQTVGLEK